MKFYKLELINREHSYNTMFGTNPNVGIMNPLGAKVNAVNSKNLVSQKDIGAKKQRIWQKLICTCLLHTLNMQWGFGVLA